MSTEQNNVADNGDEIVDIRAAILASKVFPSDEQINLVEDIITRRLERAERIHAEKLATIQLEADTKAAALRTQIAALKQEQANG